jgi:hypothetical protein
MKRFWLGVACGLVAGVGLGAVLVYKWSLFRDWFYLGML